MIDQLLPYQREGVRFLLDNSKLPFHKLLADDMGLGKSVQALAAYQMLLTKEQRSDKLLIVCPASVKYNWRKEVSKWIPGLKESIQIIEGFGGFVSKRPRVTIINYDLLKSEHILSQIKELSFLVGIVDEAHYCKNETSIRANGVLGLDGILIRARYKFLLTGTPMINRPMELWLILSTLAPSLMGQFIDQSNYGHRYCNPTEKKDECRRCGGKGTIFNKEELKRIQCPVCYGKGYIVHGWEFIGASNIDELTARIKPFMLRREYEEVKHELPKVQMGVVELPEDLADPEWEAEPTATHRHLLSQAKVPAVCEYTQDMLKEVNKVVIFGYHRDALETAAEIMSHYNPVLVYGGLSAEEKNRRVESFCTEPDVRVCIGQIHAMGQGVDGLQHVCRTILFIEVDWSPAYIDQAIGRLQRMGQTSQVQVYFFKIANSLDEAIENVVSKKRSIIDQFLERNYSDMAIETELKGIVEQLTRIADVLENPPVVAAPAPVEEKPKRASRKKKEAEPVAPVETSVVEQAQPEPTPEPEPEQETAPEPQHSWQDVMKAANECIGCLGISRDAEVKPKARVMIKERTGLDKLNEAADKPEHWDALFNGFNTLKEAITNGGSDDLTGGL